MRRTDDVILGVRGLITRETQREVKGKVLKARKKEER